MHDKIHGRDLIVVDDNAIERLEFGLGFFNDLNIRECLEKIFRHRYSLNVYCVSCSISSCVSSISDASKFSLMCCGSDDMGIVITRGWDISHASAI